MQYIEVHSSEYITLQFIVFHCSTLQGVAVHCRSLPCGALLVCGLHSSGVPGLWITQQCCAHCSVPMLSDIAWWHRRDFSRLTALFHHRQKPSAGTAFPTFRSHPEKKNSFFFTLFKSGSNRAPLHTFPSFDLLDTYDITLICVVFVLFCFKLRLGLHPSKGCSVGPPIHLKG